MSIIAHSFDTTSFSPDWAYRGIGFVLVTIFPAMFWTAVAAAIAPALGIVVTASGLAMLGAAITVFLAAVCGPLLLADAINDAA